MTAGLVAQARCLRHEGRKLLTRTGFLMSRFLVIAVAVAILVGAALFEGVRTNRWGPTEDIKAAAAKLDALPRQVGPWVAAADTQLDPKIVRVAEAVGYAARAYQHRETGATVELLILCGPSGPIAAHTPDVCFAGRGFKMAGGRARRTLPLPDGTAPSYWSARFEREATGDDAMRVCWAWGLDGNWEASESPWGEYALRPYLYKLYLTRRAAQTADADRATNPDPVEEFLTAFLPEAKKVLGP